MPPKRRVRAAASPSPAPQGRAGTPASARGGAVRAPIPAKYSTSYGSPMAALPDRSNVGGGGDVEKAAAEIFTKVQKDTQAAEARRRIKDLARQARRNVTASPEPAARQPTSDVDEGATDPEEQSEMSEEGSEYEFQDDEDDQANSRLRQKPTLKRARDDEAEARAEQEQQERAARLRRERAAETRRRAEEKQRAEAEARRLAEEKKRAEAEARRRAEEERAKAEAAEAERERLRQQALREEAARAAMPPPQPSATRSTTVTTPGSTPQAGDFSSPRPPSARSFIEERNLFLDAELQTPKPPSRPGPPPPPFVPSELPSPPTASTAASRRPVRKTTAPQIELAPPPEARSRYARQLGLGSLPSSQDSIGSAPPQYSSRTGSDPTGAEFFPEEKATRTVEESTAEQPPPTIPNNKPRYRFDVRDLFSLQSIFRAIVGAFILLHVLRLSHILVRPDQFESPVLRLNWYGWQHWQNWTSNVGQFFPSPLLHPLGVLTDDQYDDLKDYLQRRTTTTEAAVENLKAIIPKVVSVRKDLKGKVLIAPEFWDALKVRIMQDENILTLDGKSRGISDLHWKAAQERLKKAGLLGKQLSPDDVERIVEKSAPTQWEKWLQKNQRKVADMINQDKSKGSAWWPSKGSGSETLVSRDEFIRELNNHLVKSKKEIDVEMEKLRKELNDMVQKVKSSASSGGLSETEIQQLVKRIITKEVGDRQLIIGYKDGVRQVDAALRRQVNHFSPGNNAIIEKSATSPTWELPHPPPIGAKNWAKFMRNIPRFHRDPNQALTPWTDPGHCWCAARGPQGTSANAAVVAVQLAKTMIPQYVALEHIDPAATSDPGAMPKDVEVWASVDDPARRERLRDWMDATFAGDADPKLLADGFIKLGVFTYKHVPKDEGVFVHQLSSQLLSLEAATDMVLIRAVTNYGAEDHTCFYRVRLYGEVVDLTGKAEAKAKAKT